jgi:hypothetical protein
MVAHSKPDQWLGTTFDEEKCRKSLNPRQSCWALPSLAAGDVIVLPNTEEPTLLLHAASLFVVRETAERARAKRESGKPVLRNEIKGIAFLESAVLPDLVARLAGVHVCEAFREHHRELETAAEESCRRVTQAIYELGNAKRWNFAGRDVSDLLKLLLDEDLVLEDFQYTARKIVKRF